MKRDDCTPPRVLIIDDSDIVAEFSALVLEDAGFTVEVRDSHVLSPGELSGLDPAVIVLDLGMPGLSEDNVGEWIDESLRICPNARVILHSGREEEELERLAQGLRIFGYVSKSGHTAPLVHAVRAAAGSLDRA